VHSFQSEGVECSAVVQAALALTIACGGTEPAPKPRMADAVKAVADPVAEPVAAPVDLSKLSSNIPKARPDTFTFRPLRVERIPDAPPGLMEAAGRAVDRCLTQKAPQTWKLLPDASIANGKYVVRLQFRPS